METNLLTVSEAAAFLSGKYGISWLAAWRLIKKGKVKSVKIGRSRRVTLAALQEYADQLKESAS